MGYQVLVIQHISPSTAKIRTKKTFYLNNTQTVRVGERINDFNHLQVTCDIAVLGH